MDNKEKSIYKEKDINKKLEEYIMINYYNLI